LKNQLSAAQTAQAPVVAAVANLNLDSKPELAYWDARGAAAPIRYVLHYSGVEFVDTMVGDTADKA
jgi:hypothetical protein